MTKYKKAVVAFLVFCGVLGSALSDWSISAEEWSALATAALGVYGVWRVTNKSEEEVFEP